MRDCRSWCCLLCMNWPSMCRLFKHLYAFRLLLQYRQPHRPHHGRQEVVGRSASAASTSTTPWSRSPASTPAYLMAEMEKRTTEAAWMRGRLSAQQEKRTVGIGSCGRVLGTAENIAVEPGTLQVSAAAQAPVPELCRVSAGGTIGTLGTGVVVVVVWMPSEGTEADLLLITENETG